MRIRSSTLSLAALGYDVRYAVRTLTRSPTHVAWVVGSLAIGMAVAMAALTFLNALLFRPLPGISSQHELVRLRLLQGCGRGDCWTTMDSVAEYRALQGGLSTASGVTAYTGADLAVHLPHARSLQVVFASANYFDVLGARPSAGRVFGDETGPEAVAVISHRLWIGEFGSDPAVLGRSAQVGGRSVEIVGIGAPGFIGPDHRLGRRGPDLWLPLSIVDEVIPRAARPGDGPALQFLARMRPGVDAAAVQAEGSVIAAAAALRRTASAASARAETEPISIVKRQHRSLTVLLILPIPLLVLAIACVNAANLMLVRASQRRREIAIRLAIGAGRGRIVSQLLIESAALAALAMCIAVPVSSFALALASTPLQVPIRPDLNVFALAMLMVAATTLAFGTGPALRLSSPAAANALAPAAADSQANQGRRRAVLVGQVALSLGLLVTGAQLVATVVAQGASGRTPADQLLLARFNVDPVGMTPQEATSFYGRVLDSAARLPGVEAAGLARHTAVWTFGQGKRPASLVTWTDSSAGEGRVHVGGYAGGDLIGALGLRLSQGRTFAEGDRVSPPRVAIINEVLAASMEGPVLGRTIRVAPWTGSAGSPREVVIVGVIESVLEPRASQDGEPLPRIYIPSPMGAEPALTLYVRSRTRATDLAGAVQGAIAAIDPRVPVLELGSLADVNERSMGPQLWLARAAAMLGIIGLLLATAGLYGVASYVVAMRSREIAIRMAIGAAPGRVLRMMLGQSMRLALVGLTLGVALAAAASRLIQAEFHGVQGLDPLAFGGSAALFLAAMLLASGIPALRAARVDPIGALKEGH